MYAERIIPFNGEYIMQMLQYFCNKKIPAFAGAEPESARVDRGGRIFLDMAPFPCYSFLGT